MDWRTRHNSSCLGVDTAELRAGHSGFRGRDELSGDRETKSLEQIGTISSTLESESPR